MSYSFILIKYLPIVDLSNVYSIFNQPLHHNQNITTTTTTIV